MFARDELDAMRYAKALEEAARIFNLHFGKAAPPVAIVEGAERANAMRDALRSQGFKLVLPWLAAADKRSALQSAIRQQVKTSRPELSEAAVDALVADGVNQANLATAIDPEGEAGAIAHELCHFFLIDAFGFLSDQAGAAHYGGAAPDWMDETAAVLCENETLTAGRYGALKSVVDGENGARFWPLATFLKMTHPMARVAVRRSSGERFSVSIQVSVR